MIHPGAGDTSTVRSVFIIDPMYTLAMVGLAVAAALRPVAGKKLAVAGLTSFLTSRPDQSADLVIAADVFVYLGELSAVFAQSARVLKPEGLLAFTVQSHAGDGVIVGELSGYTRPGHCLVHIDNERSLWLPVDALSSEPPQAALFDPGA